MKYRHPNDVRRTINGSTINHIINEHGIESKPVKNGTQKPVTEQDILKWTEYSDNADFKKIKTDETKRNILLSAKQINGYYVVVESISKKENELGLKTMYFEKGRLDKHPELRSFSQATTD